ncbi:ABC transporter ATP-binding protein [Clostridium sp. UBA4395]|uniref:ABC transporter ATP-binding protein n=1 Tax=Clostridium sp. UBA4395 TaxID=1946360 RepID=UPI003217CF4E
MNKIIINKLIKSKQKVIILLIMSFITTIITFLKPYLSSKFFDLIIKPGNINLIIKLILLILIVTIFQMIIGYIYNIVKIKFTSIVTFSGLNYIMKHLKKIPLEEYNKIESNYLADRLINDTSEVVEFIIDNIFDVIKNTTLIVISFYIIFKIKYNIIIMLIPIILIYYQLYKSFKTKIYRSNFEYTDKQSKFLSNVIYQIKNIKIIKVNNWYDESEYELKNIFNELLTTSVNVCKISYFYNNIQSIFSVLGNLIIMTYCGVLVNKNILTLGEFLMVNSYFNIILTTVNYFLSFSESYQKYLVAKNRINKYISIKEETNGTIDINNIEYIEIRNISFSYNDERRIIKNFNCEFKRGKIYCINGENGSGKSTLCDLLLGLYENYLGDIIFNSTNLRDINIYSFRNNIISICNQELNMFYYDKNNIKNDYFNVTGLNSKINLSGGEKQKLLINRILNKDSDVMILDEPSSALDRNSVEKLKEVILQLKKEKIIILITHDSRLLSIADIIFDIN